MRLSHAEIISLCELPPGLRENLKFSEATCFQDSFFFFLASVQAGGACSTLVRILAGYI